MRTYRKNLCFFMTALFFAVLPQLTFAATIPPAQAASISAQLSSIASELAAASTVNSIILAPGQSAIQATSSPSDGVIHITYINELQENPDPTIPPINVQNLPKLAQISLQYSPCINAASTPGTCMTQTLQGYPLMISELPVGGSTGYLHSIITLSSLGTTTASFTFASATSLSTIQNEIAAVAAEMHALLGS